MSKVTVEVRNNTLVLPTDAIEQLGWREGTTISIKKHNGNVVLRPQEFTEEEIENIACIYLLEYVGDATAVKTPVWNDGKWRVEVVLSYRPETVGFLTFSPDGQLIDKESDSAAKMKGISL